MGDTEDRRLGIGIDRDDELGRAHAFEMFGCAGDAGSDIEFGLDLAPRLADLALLRQPPGIDNRSAARDLGAECRCDLLGDRDAVLVTDATADAEDAVGLGQVDGAGRRPRLAHESRAEFADLRLAA